MSMDDNLNVRRPRKPYRKMTLACLFSQFCTELGPALPQLVYLYFHIPFITSKLLALDKSSRCSYFLSFSLKYLPNKDMLADVILNEGKHS